MLACLCPLKSAAEESLNTLHFASMALRIKSTPVIMMDPQVMPPEHSLLPAVHTMRTYSVQRCQCIAREDPAGAPRGTFCVSAQRK